MAGGRYWVMLELEVPAGVCMVLARVGYGRGLSARGNLSS